MQTVLLNSEGCVISEAGVVKEDKLCLAQFGGMYCKIRIFCDASD